MVHGYIRKLRSLLDTGPDRDARQLVATSREGYRLHVDTDQLDLIQFDDLVARAQTTDGDPGASARLGLFRQAVARYQEIRTRLADQLGLEPGAEITAAYLRVPRQQVPAEAVVMRHPVAAQSPPSGLGPIPPGQLPAELRAFVGRTSALARLDTLLPDEGGRADTAPTVVVIEGPAGVGKTALAVRWAHQVAHRFTDGQLYLDLRGFSQDGSPMEPPAASQALLETLGVPPTEVPHSLAARTGLYRSMLTHRRVLIVLDNALDTEQVRPLLPGSGGCLVVVTSRRQLTGLVAASGAHPLALEPLPTPEARDFSPAAWVPSG